jgi:hypothetical protein
MMPDAIQFPATRVPPLDGLGGDRLDQPATGSRVDVHEPGELAGGARGCIDGIQRED